MIGPGVAMVYVPTLKVLSSWSRRDEFSTLTGVLLMIGSVGGPATAGPLAAMSDYAGWRQVFLALAVLTAVLTWLMWPLVRDRPQDVGLPAVEELEEEKVPLISALHQVFGSGIRFWPFAVIFFMYGSLMVYQGLLGGRFFRDVLGWDKAEYGLSLTFVGLGMISALMSKERVWAEPLDHPGRPLELQMVDELSEQGGRFGLIRDQVHFYSVGLQLPLGLLTHGRDDRSFQQRQRLILPAALLQLY